MKRIRLTGATALLVCLAAAGAAIAHPTSAKQVKAARSVHHRMGAASRVAAKKTHAAKAVKPKAVVTKAVKPKAVVATAVTNQPPKHQMTKAQLAAREARAQMTLKLAREAHRGAAAHH